MEYGESIESGKWISALQSAAIILFFLALLFGNFAFSKPLRVQPAAIEVSVAPLPPKPKAETKAAKTPPPKPKVDAAEIARKQTDKKIKSCAELLKESLKNLSAADKKRRKKCEEEKRERDEKLAAKKAADEKRKQEIADKKAADEKRKRDEKIAVKKAADEKRKQEIAAKRERQRLAREGVARDKNFIQAVGKISAAIGDCMEPHGIDNSAPPDTGIPEISVRFTGNGKMQSPRISVSSDNDDYDDELLHRFKSRCLDLPPTVLLGDYADTVLNDPKLLKRFTGEPLEFPLNPR